MMIRMPAKANVRKLLAAIDQRLDTIERELSAAPPDQLPALLDFADALADLSYELFVELKQNPSNLLDSLTEIRPTPADATCSAR